MTAERKMTFPNERRVVVGTDGDVARASRAALLLARQAGLSVMRQYCLAGLVAELGQGVVRRSAHAVLVLRDDSNARQARLGVTVQGRGPSDQAALEQAPLTADSWTARWRGSEPARCAVEPVEGGTRLSFCFDQARSPA
jgi:hypothetical protein